MGLRDAIPSFIGCYDVKSARETGSISYPQSNPIVQFDIVSPSFSHWPIPFELDHHMGQGEIEKQNKRKKNNNSNNNNKKHVFNFYATLELPID